MTTPGLAATTRTAGTTDRPRRFSQVSVRTASPSLSRCSPPRPCPGPACSCTPWSPPACDGALVIINFLAREHTELNGTLRTYTLVALLCLGLITTIAGFQSGRLLAPLRTLEETARDITATDLSRRIPERGNDDITALTRTINLMLERLDAGFTDQRRFLDDAGHELKTP